MADTKYDDMTMEELQAEALRRDLANRDDAEKAIKRPVMTLFGAVWYFIKVLFWLHVIVVSVTLLFIFGALYLDQYVKAGALKGILN